MTIRSTTRLAAGAAAGAIALTLAVGGAAYADDITAPAEAAAVTGATSTTAPDGADPAPDAAPAPAPDAAPAPAPDAAAAATPAPTTTETAASVDAAPADTTTADAAPEATAPVETAPTETAPAAPAPAAASAGSAPTVTLDMPAVPASGWFTGGVNIAMSAADVDGDLATTSIQFDGGTVWTAGVPTRSIQINSDGRHVLSTWATDAAGNVSAVQTREVNIDRTGPRVTSYSIPNGRILKKDSRVQLTYICADDLSGLESCTTDGRLPDWTLDTSVVGEHSFDIVGVDKAGNRSVTEYRYRVSDDSTSPTVSAAVTGDAVDGWFVGDAAVTIRLEDDEPEQTIIEYRINGEYQNAAGPEVVIPITSDGVFEIEYQGRDAVDNLSDPQFLTVRRDTAAPAIALEATDGAGNDVADGATVTRGADIRLAYECTDAASGVDECSAAVASGNPVDTVTVGDHSVVLTATDAAGNETSARFSYTVVAAPGDPATPAEPAPVDPAPATPAPAPASAPRPAAAGTLAVTGADDTTPLALAAAALVAAGASFTAIGLRRRSAR